MHSATLLLCLLPASPVLADEGDDQYQFVAGLCEQGHYAVAVREARKFLEEHPKHPKVDLARYRLASALFELDRPSEAAPHFRDLTGRDGFEYRPESWMRLGQCELACDRPAAARTALREAYGSDQAYLRPAAAFFLGECGFALEEYAPAKARYRQALEAESAAEYHAHALRGLAWCEFYLGEYESCARLARAFAAKHAGDELEAEMRFLLGDAELEAGAPERAEQAWARIESGPFHDAALRGRAFARSRRGDLAGAADLFVELLRRYPEGRFAREATLQGGAHLLRAGRGREALELLSSPTAGEDPEGLYWRGRAQGECGEPEAALATLERAARGADPELLDRIRTAQGDLLFELGRLDESAKAYGDAQSDYALHAAATARLADGDEEEAVRLARRMLERYPDSPYAATTRLALAEGLFTLGELAEARRLFEELLAAAWGLDDENRARCAARIGWCLYLAGERDAARAAFAAVNERFPASAECEEARYMEGRAALEAGSDEAAASAWRGYLEEHPGGAHESEVLLELSRLEPGTSRLVRLLESAPDDPRAPQALYELAEKLGASGAGEPAIARYGELIERFPESELVPAARYGLAWQLRAAGRPGLAADQLDALLRRSPPAELELAALELSIWVTAEAGRSDACLAAWRAFDPRCGDEARRLAAARTTARALETAGEREAARALLLELTPRLRTPALAGRASVEGAWLALGAGDLDAAEVRVVEALQLLPGDRAVLEAAFFVAEERFEAGEPDRAAALYRVAADPAAGALRDDALYKLGFALLRLEEHAGAAEAFETLCREHPRSELFGESLFLAGECRFREGDPRRAAEHLERVRAELPRHEIRPKALFRLGAARVALGEHQAAVVALTELGKKYRDFPNRAEAELLRGRALAALEKPRAARSAFDEVLRLDRGVLSARARIEIGRLHVAAGRPDDALSEFLKVALLYAHEDEVAEAKWLAGQCLEAQGEAEAAARQYAELIEKHGDSRFAAAAKQRLRRLRIR